MLILWKSIDFWLRKVSKSSTAEKLAEVGKIAILKGEAGIHEFYEQAPEAESALKLSEATAKLIQSLEKIPEAVVRAGPLLVVKVTTDGQPRIAAETMSANLRRMLDQNPELLRNPHLLLQNLQKKLGTKENSLDESTILDSAQPTKFLQ